MPEHGHLNDVLVILLAAICCVALFQRLRITPVLGYLVAGIAIGPHAAGLIHDPEGTELLAEFGVIFLLFTIGLDLPLRRLVEMRHLIFGLGLAQVALTSIAIAVVAYAAGVPAEAALILGGALALSSTATVLQLLIERRELADRHGRLSVAVLLFQDLAVVPLLALLPILAGGSTNIVGALGLAAVKAAAAIALILLLGRLLLRPIYRVIAETRNPEIFAATNLLIVLATGYATAQAGMSMALGAFLAGLLLADTEYRHQIEADIQPFRGLFLGLFFITVGMSIDLGRIWGNLLPLVGLTVALLAGKAAILYALLRAFRQGHRMAARVALLLAQGGEFAFVVLGLALSLDVVTEGVGQALLAVVALSMATTPVFAWAGRRYFGESDRRESTAEQLEAATGDLDHHVLVAGFGRVGWTVCKLLERNDVPYVALDFDMERVRRGRNETMPVYFGDASRLEVLRAAGLERARAAVITLDQPGLAERAVGALRGHDAHFTIVSRARDGQHRKRLELAGASAVVSEAVEASLQLGATVLRLSGTPESEVEESLTAFRRDDYALLDQLLEQRQQKNGEPQRDDPGSWFARHVPALRRNRRSARSAQTGRPGGKDAP
jgi:CPA2 family monovalent cation:H+ antiporter-2